MRLKAKLSAVERKNQDGRDHQIGYEEIELQIEENSSEGIVQNQESQDNLFKRFQTFNPNYA
jgi:hypothetical protein